MEWVETTARTVEEAKNLALDQLGVDADEAEFEVIDEPRPGLFGRMRGEARVRARVRPTRPRPKLERRGRERRRRGTETSSGSSPSAADDETVTVEPGVDDQVDQAQDAHDTPRPKSGPSRRRSRGGRGRGAPVSPDPEPAGASTDMSESTDATPSTTPSVDPATVGQEATTFLEGLLEAFDLEGAVSCHQDGNELDVRVEGSDLGLLVGPRGSTLVAVQDLARVVSQRRLGDHETRLRVDVAGYRERRREALARFATTMADEVVASGVARVLEPMASADRKVVHDVLALRDDVTTRSEGDEPSRRVVIEPTA